MVFTGNKKGQLRLAFFIAPERMMHKGPFLASQFTATKWSSQSDKAEFGNTLLHFIHAGFQQRLFTQKLYERLSNTFGHIAHYNRVGFWEEWFSDEAAQVRFLEHLLHWPCYGDPEFTFSDVERELHREVMARDYLLRYQVLADAAQRAKEIAALERLEAKYRVPRIEEPAVGAPRVSPSTIEDVPLSECLPVQGSLF